MNEIIELYQDYWKKFADFEGYATVKAYWLTVLACWVVSLLVGVIARIPLVGGVVAAIYGIACIIPSLSLGARRLRDAGYNPLWLLIYLVPCIGWIALIVMFCMPSKQQNVY